jgi:hypothetical protein
MPLIARMPASGRFSSAQLAEPPLLYSFNDFLNSCPVGLRLIPIVTEKLAHYTTYYAARNYKCRTMSQNY